MDPLKRIQLLPMAQFPSGLSGANRVKLFPETNGPIPLPRPF